MAAAAKRLAISSRIASKTGFVEVSNGTYGSKFRCFGSASAASDALKEERESKKISKLERRAMLEAFVDQYRASNAGRFPAISFAQKQIGGSYYFVRQIIQELEFKYRMSLLGKNKDGQVRKAQQGGNPALLLKEVCHPCEIEELSKPIVSTSCVSYEDIDKGSEIRPENSSIVDLATDELLDRKEPLVSSAETASVKKAVKHSCRPSKKKIVECTKNSSINGVSSSGTQMRTDESMINSMSGLTGTSLQQNDQGSNPALLLKEVPGPSEIEEVSKPVASASLLYKDIHTGSEIGSGDSTIVDLVIDDELLDRKDHSVSSTVETVTIRKAVKHARNSSRKKIVDRAKNSSINGASSSGNHTRADESRTGTASGLGSESLQHSDHDSKRDEANSSVSSMLGTTVHILNSSHLHAVENEELKSTEHLHDRNEPNQIDQIGSIEAPESEELIGDRSKKVEIRESSPARSDLWGNLKALGNSFVNFWRKK